MEHAIANPSAVGGVQKAMPDIPRECSITAVRLILMALTVLVATPAAAQRRLRHEFVPRSFFERNQVSAQVGVALEEGEPVPRAVQRDGERLPAPGRAEADEPTFGAPADGGIARPTEARPDRDTGSDSALRYHATFNPSVAPLRRNVAFDAMDADYRLHIGPGALRPVPLSERAAVPGRELFWGDVRVGLSPGQPAGLPSVAPDMRILAVRTEPEVAVEFLKDGADNFYVRSRWRGDVRVVFLADADATYFSGPSPGNVPLGVQAGQPHTGIPRAARAPAQRVLEALQVSPQLPFDRGLDRLVAWFRDFAAGSPPSGRADIYEDLALGQTGVCRHRAFAFLVTARAVGVPTRYVQNEAHAFVEIRAPDGRWRRIDLGGEAPSLDISGGQDRRLHTPPPDAFAKPERYLSQYSAMLGGNQAPGAGRPGPPVVKGAPEALGGGGATDGGAGGGEAGAFGGGPTSDPDAPFSDATAEVPLPRLAPDDAPDGTPISQQNDALPVYVRVEAPTGRSEAFRGEKESFEVTGHVTAAQGSAPIPGVKVQVYLLRGDDDGVAVGAAVRTDGRGRFVVPVDLPATLTLGEYRLVAASSAHDQWSSGRSDVP